MNLIMRLKGRAKLLGLDGSIRHPVDTNALFCQMLYGFLERVVVVQSSLAAG